VNKGKKTHSNVIKTYKENEGPRPDYFSAQKKIGFVRKMSKRRKREKERKKNTIKTQNEGDLRKMEE
jgi:hypothetical protein